MFHFISTLLLEQVMAQRHLYLRDYYKINKHPVGCVAVEVDRAANEIRYALSACSPLDHWNAKVARDKAFGRLVKSPTIIRGDIPESTHAITRQIMEHIVTIHGTQQKDKSRSYLALEAAKTWLTKVEPTDKTC